MDCKKALSLLPAYFDKQLKGSDEKWLQEHLKLCSGCREELSKLDRLEEALRAIAQVRLPQTLGKEFGYLVRNPKVGQYLSPKKPILIVRKQSRLDKALTIARYTLSWSIVVAVLLFFLLETLSTIPYRIPKSVDQGGKRVEKVELKSDEAQKKNAQVKVLSKKVTPPAPPALGKIIKPQVAVLHKSYDEESVKEAIFKPVVLEFNATYAVAHVLNVQDVLVSDAAKRAGRLGEDESAAYRCIKTALLKLNKPALPAYVEKASFKNQDIWLIVLVWSNKGFASYLSNASIFAVDPQRNAVVYSE